MIFFFRDSWKVNWFGSKLINPSCAGNSYAGTLAKSEDLDEMQHNASFQFAKS